MFCEIATLMRATSRIIYYLKVFVLPFEQLYTFGKYTNLLIDYYLFILNMFLNVFY